MSSLSTEVEDGPYQAKSSNVQTDGSFGKWKEEKLAQISLADHPTYNMNDIRGMALHASPSEFLKFAKLAIDETIKDIRKAKDNPINKTMILNSEMEACMFSMSANVCQSDHRASGNPDSLEEAIICQRQALLLIGERHLMRPYLLNALGGLLYNRFKQVGNPEDANESVECFIQALRQAPEGHSSRPGYLDNLGISWCARFKQSGLKADLDQAIECQSQAVQITPENHPNKVALLNNLGNSWVSRFKLLRDLADLNEAISCQTQALELAPEVYAYKTTLLNNIGCSMLHRFELLGDLADLDKAVEYGIQAIQVTPEGQANRPTLLNNLGSWILRRFEQVGDMVDVDKAIEYQEEALGLTSDDDPDKLTRLNSIGHSRLRRFEKMGNIEDLEKSIEHQMQAIQLLPSGHIDKPIYLSNLGYSWSQRFGCLSNLEDIENAIKCGEESTLLFSDDNIAKSTALMNLGCSYLGRFALLQQLADIDKAIHRQTEAVQLVPNDHTDKQLYLNNLAQSWMYRFEVLSEPADLDKAIQCQAQAVELTPEGHSDRSLNLNNRKDSLAFRKTYFGSPGSAYTSVEHLAQAALLISNIHGDQQDHIIQPGDVRVDRPKLLDKRTATEYALILLQPSADPLNIIEPETQIQCASKWAAGSIELGLSPLAACEKTFRLMPRLMWISTTIQRRYSILTKLGSLTTQAVAWAISVGYFDLAIEWLEKGRSIAWAQVLQFRVPFENLNIVGPGLANHLKSIISDLGGAVSRVTAVIPGTTPDISRNPEYKASHEQQMAAQWERILAEARQLPGFDDFLPTRKVQELKTAASNGPIVIINTHHKRCDALIIFPELEDVVHVPLDTFSQSKAVECRKQIASVIGHRGESEKSRGVKHYCKAVDPQQQLWPLKVLWSDVVAPVLEALAIINPQPYDELPHITWCATGALSFLPLHAAGPYDGISPNAFDLIVSSYTPTLSALLSRNSPSFEADAVDGVLVVGQANSPGFPPLPKTVEELAIIKKCAGSIPCQQLDGPLATVDATQNAMKSHSWVHLACHATQNRSEPIQSAFHLYDGKLTLEEINKPSRNNKGLAFLSACQTATGDDELPDEATHLAAGMLIAGYPSVIATMWSIMDEDAPEIAEGVYAELMQGGKLDHRNSARALHKAVGKLREKVGPELIARWAPFIHIGV